MIIELLRNLDFFYAHTANNVRPPTSPLGSPPPEIRTLDNRVQYPAGTRLEVEHDDEWEEFEPREGETWFKSAEHPTGFRVPNANFRYIEVANDWGDSPQQSGLHVYEVFRLQLPSNYN